MTMFLFGSQLKTVKRTFRFRFRFFLMNTGCVTTAFKVQFDNIWHPIYNSQKFFAPETIVIRIQYRTKGSTMGSYNTLFICIIC